MNKRNFLISSMATLTTTLWAQDKWGESKGFPTGWGPAGKKKMQTGWPDYLIGNFSSGFEHLFDFRVIKAPPKSSRLIDKPTPFKLNFWMSLPEYQVQNGKPALLIAKNDTVYYEHYAFDRTASMRFNGKSMSKSVVALLCGLAFDLGLFKRLDDPIEKFDSRLKGTPLGPVTLRQALNMSSGVDICRALCSPVNHYERFERDAFAGTPDGRAMNTDHDAVLIHWKHGVNKQAKAYNYNPIDPQLVAMAIRGASGMGLTEFTRQALWEPMGAQADATWLVDSKGVEHAPAGFNATLRDWGRLGLLVAQNGALGGKQVISESWMNECKIFHPAERYLEPRNIANKPNSEGYKFFFHRPTDTMTLRFGGDFSQSIFADTQLGITVVVLSVKNGGKDYSRILELARSELK